MKKNILIAIVSFVLVIFNVQLSFAQEQCEVDFYPVKNLTSKYAGVSGTHFKFIVINKSDFQDTYTILVENSDIDSDKSIHNKNNRKKEKFEVYNRIKIDGKNSGSFSNKDEKGNNRKTSDKSTIEISLKPNEEVMFKIKLDVPDGTLEGGINTTKLSLASKKCKKILKTQYVYTEFVDGE